MKKKRNGEQDSVGKPPRPARLAQLLALVLAVGLAFLCFFSLMEIVLTLAATFIYHNVESAVRGKYALVSVRNFYLLLGGMGLLAFVIGYFDYCVKRLGSARVWRTLAAVVAAEAVIVMAERILTR